MWVAVYEFSNKTHCRQLHQHDLCCNHIHSPCVMSFVRHCNYKGMPSMVMLSHVNYKVNLAVLRESC